MPQFPDNPRVGDIVHVAPNEEHGAITQIRLEASNIFGEAQAISRIPTSERKFLLKNVTFDSTVELLEGLQMRVQVMHFPINSYRFVEDCGWTPFELGDPITSLDRIGLVLREPVLTLSIGTRYNIFNEVCVDLPPLDEKEKENAKS